MMTSAAQVDAPRPAWMDKGRVPCLDGLRGVSILLVLLEHASLTKGFPFRPGRVLGEIGSLGVSMFFAISGFLITLLLVREWSRVGTVSLRDFYRRRALRILPAYVTFLLAVFGLTRLQFFELTRADWMAAVTYTMNFVSHPSWEVGHLWSLSVEEQFYLVWPVTFLLATPASAFRYLAVYMVSAPAIRYMVLAVSGNETFIENATLLHVDAIAAGCLLALVASNETARRKLTPSVEFAVKAFAAGVIVLAILHLTATEASYRLRYFNDTVGYSIAALAMVTIIWSAAFASETSIGRVLSSRLLTFVGVLSYSLYLWQELFLNRRRTFWFSLFPQNVLLAVGVALVSHYVVESPFLRIKDRRPGEIEPSVGSGRLEQQNLHRTVS